MAEILRDSVYYAAKTKLMELAVELSEVRNPLKLESQIIQGAKIHRLLQGLDYEDYLTQQQIDRIVRTLVEVAEINDFPVAPVLGNVDQPSIVIGGSTTINNYNSSDSTEFSNLSVTSPSEVIDSFAYTESNGVRWEYNIRTSTAIRKGSFSTGWLSDGSDIDDGAEISSADIGDTSPVVLSCDISGGNVRLIATVSSGTWTITGRRYLD